MNTGTLLPQYCNQDTPDSISTLEEFLWYMAQNKYGRMFLHKNLYQKLSGQLVKSLLFLDESISKCEQHCSASIDPLDFKVKMQLENLKSRMIQCRYTQVLRIQSDTFNCEDLQHPYITLEDMSMVLNSYVSEQMKDSIRGRIVYYKRKYIYGL